MATTVKRRAGTGLPRAGTWLIDPHTAAVAFSGRASRLTPMVRACFTGVTGSVVAAPDPDRTEIDVVVDVTTMSSGNRAWDDLLAVADPFQADTWPCARFRSSAVRWHGAQVLIDGVLTLRGIGQALTLAAEHSLDASAERLTIRAGGSVDREGFGIRCDVPGARLFMPRTLQLEIEVQATYAG